MSTPSRRWVARLAFALALPALGLATVARAEPEGIAPPQLVFQRGVDNRDEDQFRVISPDGDWSIAWRSREIAIRSSLDGHVLYRVHRGTEVLSAGITPDGATLCIAERQPWITGAPPRFRIAAWDLRRNRERWQVDVSAFVWNALGVRGGCKFFQDDLGVGTYRDSDGALIGAHVPGDLILARAKEARWSASGWLLLTNQAEYAALFHADPFELAAVITSPCAAIDDSGAVVRAEGREYLHGSSPPEVRVDAARCRSLSPAPPTPNPHARTNVDVGSVAFGAGGKQLVIRASDSVMLQTLDPFGLPRRIATVALMTRCQVLGTKTLACKRQGSARLDRWRLPDGARLSALSLPRACGGDDDPSLTGQDDGATAVVCKDRLYFKPAGRGSFRAIDGLVAEVYGRHFAWAGTAGHHTLLSSGVHANQVFDLDAGRLRWAHEGTGDGVAFSPDQTLIALEKSHAGERELALVDAATGADLQHYSFEGNPSFDSLVWNADGVWVGFDADDGGRIDHLVIAADGTVTRHDERTAMLRMSGQVTPSPDGTFIVTSNVGLANDTLTIQGVDLESRLVMHVNERGAAVIGADGTFGCTDSQCDALRCTVAGRSYAVTDATCKPLRRTRWSLRDLLRAPPASPLTD